jgi:hypothetical protein
MRISIKKHNQAYLESLASQMGITDISEVLNYLLLDIKGLNYQFGNKPQPQPRQAPIGYSFDTSTFEPAFTPIPEVDRNSIDPIIARMASLIEEF